MDEDLRKKVKQIKVRGFSDPWANLAAAILHTGIASHDELFLNSKWARQLIDMVDLASELDDHKYGGIRTGAKNSSKSFYGRDE